MRPLVLAILAMAGLRLVACSSSAEPAGPDCFTTPVGCSCNVQASPAQSSQVSSCNTSGYPDTQCCADTGWPSSGSCNCLTSAIFCGVVPGYETAADGGFWEDACVCSNDPYAEQTIGPTCYANGTTTAGDGLGICCLFSADAPDSLGLASCSCAAGLHTCGAGGTQVESCSAASIPMTTATCGAGSTQVASCL
jgi:hypothetical protein